MPLVLCIIFDGNRGVPRQSRESYSRKATIMWDQDPPILNCLINQTIKEKETMNSSSYTLVTYLSDIERKFIPCNIWKQKKNKKKIKTIERLFALLWDNTPNFWPNSGNSRYGALQKVLFQTLPTSDTCITLSCIMYWLLCQRYDVKSCAGLRGISILFAKNKINENHQDKKGEI